MAQREGQTLRGYAAWQSWDQNSRSLTVQFFLCPILLLLGPGRWVRTFWGAGREVAGGVPGLSLSGSGAFFLLTENPAQAWVWGGGLAAVFSCSVVGSSVFQDGPVGVYAGAGSWARAASVLAGCCQHEHGPSPSPSLRIQR